MLSFYQQLDFWLLLQNTAMIMKCCIMWEHVTW